MAVVPLAPDEQSVRSGYEQETYRFVACRWEERGRAVSA